MADYPPNEIIDIIMVLGQCNNNYRLAARQYAEQFPNRRYPNDRTIQRLTQRARNGRLVRQRRHHNYDENDARAVTVLATVHIDPHVSSRLIKREIGIPRTTALRILKSLKYHPYHISSVHELRPNHIQMQIEFCLWALRMIEEDPEFFRYVMFSDEAKIYSDGQLNSVITQLALLVRPQPSLAQNCRPSKPMEPYGLA